MKNIHLIPTEKPSRLIIYSTLLNEFRLLTEPITDWKHKRHLYITSDEEIKEGDWIYNEEREPSVVQSIGKGSLRGWKKIILTTDSDLIADGVQAIDDEFLEWFVKNPSCDEVEVTHQLHKDEPLYQIIIPQEEPKCTCKEHNPCCCQVHGSCSTCVKQEEHTQETLNLDEMKSKLNNALDNETEESLTDWLKSKRGKQETLEEDLKFPLIIENGMDYLNLTTKIFNNGAKWQSQRMYSEENMKQFAYQCVANFLSNKNNEVEHSLVAIIVARNHLEFEQFKKK